MKKVNPWFVASFLALVLYGCSRGLNRDYPEVEKKQEVGGTEVEPEEENQPPLAVDQSTIVDKDTVAVLPLPFSDADGSRDVVACQTQDLSSGGALGACSCGNGVCSVELTPDSGFIGVITFLFTVTDQKGATSAAASVSVTFQ